MPPALAFEPGRGAPNAAPSPGPRPRRRARSPCAPRRIEGARWRNARLRVWDRPRSLCAAPPRIVRPIQFFEVARPRRKQRRVAAQRLESGIRVECGALKLAMIEQHAHQFGSAFKHVAAERNAALQGAGLLLPFARTAQLGGALEPGLLRGRFADEPFVSRRNGMRERLPRPHCGGDFVVDGVGGCWSSWATVRCSARTAPGDCPVSDGCAAAAPASAGAPSARRVRR